MKTSLIITTYNWKEALAAVLESVKRQTVLPDEVIIADDGSREDTAELIKKYQQTFPVPLIHSWIEDAGFRLSKSRNVAINKSLFDYIIMIDGDIFLSPSFIESHLKSAQKNWFVQGGRVQTNEACAQNIINTNIIPNLFSKGLRNRKNCINNSIMSKIFSFERNNDKATRGCNMAFWRSDVLEINGFNEDFIGWGREDSEFTHRMLNLGRRRLYLKFSAVGYHLFHPENSKDMLNKRDIILENTIKNKLIRCENGINKF